jgi:hypothetical protein
MKALCALILIVSTSAMANNIRMFTGKYSVIKCQIEVDRVYITVEKLRTTTNLNIHYYSDLHGV